MLRLIPKGGPALCNIAVTNACNATCDFCNFARGKVPPSRIRWIDADRFDAALNILFERGIRYVSFFGGEPLLHPRITDIVGAAAQRQMGTALITNGWLLPQFVDRLAAASCGRLPPHPNGYDAYAIAGHDRDCQVTMNRLIRDYQALISLVRELGFSAVAFSYPQRARLGSSSLAWSDSSSLVNFTNDELADTFDRINSLRRLFPINNPQASVEDMKRHLRGTPERFVCYGGYKSFYMDWNYEMWRCDAWSKSMCSVWEFGEAKLVRDGCTACIADCYRDSSVMLQFSVSSGDAIDHLAEGRFLSALRTLMDRRNLSSLGAILANGRVLSKLAKLG